jgi:hypothetical protein
MGVSLLKILKICKDNQWLIFLPLGAVLIAAGLSQGDYKDTLSKAIRICLECIGIG